MCAPLVSREQIDSPLSGGMGHTKAQETVNCLTKDGVRQGRNKRQGESSDGQGSNAGYSGGYSTGNQTGGSYGGGSTQQRVSSDTVVQPNRSTGYSSGGYQQSKSVYGGGRSLHEQVRRLI